MLNLIPKSLRVSMKLCAVAVLLLSCSGCSTATKVAGTIGAATLIHFGINDRDAIPSGEVIYTQAPYVEPEAKVGFSNQSTAKQP